MRIGASYNKMFPVQHFKLFQLYSGRHDLIHLHLIGINNVLVLECIKFNFLIQL